MNTSANAKAVLRSTDEKENFHRLTRLLMCGGVTLLREKFDSFHSPTDLQARLGDPTIFRKLNKAKLSQPERDILYPRTGTFVKSTDFNITLTFRLLRTICNLTEPLTGWNTLPNSTDHSLEAELARIKHYRNYFCHHRTMEINNSEFDNLWKDISEALLRIAESISKEKRREWEKAITEFRNSRLTREDQRYLDELKLWYNKDMKDVKDAVGQLGGQLQHVEDAVGQLKDQLQQVSQKQDYLIICIDVERFSQGRPPIASSHFPIATTSSEAAPSTNTRTVIVPSHEEQPQFGGAGGTSREHLEGDYQDPPTGSYIWRVILSPAYIGLQRLLEYLKVQLGVNVVSHREGSLLITVTCSSLQILEGLWEDYISGNLSKVVEEALVTPYVLEKLGLSKLKLKTTITEEKYNKCKEFFLTRDKADVPEVTQYGLKQRVKDISQGGTKASRKAQFAVPLCLPTNYKWNTQTGECMKIGKERSPTLYVIEEALNQLNSIKGPVCVVSVSGPLRKGKSYVLSKAFNQPSVFRLGHTLEPETVGIWMWIVPEIYSDCNGQDFRVVLLDCEGIGDTSSENHGDCEIFTLTVLLASLLIYNSSGVPERKDREQLELVVNLSQQIQAHRESTSTDKDSAYFRKTFPRFFWLLRDVTLSVPEEYDDITDYFLRNVFREKGSSSTNQGTYVFDSLLRFFPGFDSFTLPLPTDNEDILKNIDQEESKLNPSFLRDLKKLKDKLDTLLSPKHSCNDGEFVTGEALAALISNYVAALNTPGIVPNVQSAWETFIQTKCFEVKAAAMRLYEGTITSQLDGALPCDSDDIRRVHEMAMEESLKGFQTGTIQISAESCNKYLEELMEHKAKDLKRWHEENERHTKKSCQKLQNGLKKKYLDPIFQRLTGPMGASVSFDEIKDSFLAIERDFKKLAKGAKDVCAQEFFKFQKELQSEMKKHKARLEQLKDYDAKLTQEKKDRALQEKEKQRILEENARLLKETRTKQEEMKLLIQKTKSDMKRLEEQHQKEIKEQQIQIDNRIKAEVDLYKVDMDAMAEQNRELKDKMEELNQDMKKKSHEIRRMKMASSSTYMGVVAIDFGTTYSGFAFSFSDQNGQGGIHTKMNWGENKELERSGTPKTPTTILLLPNKNFDSFGYDADDTYVNLKPGDDKQYYYFKHFKMELHKRQDLDRNTQLTAANGKNVDAITVFSLSMKYLKDEAVKTIREATKDNFHKAEDFQWVLTVPAIWTAAAKQFMREAAYQAGIASPDNKEQLIIALEPEAGAIFCKERKLKDFVGQTGSARVSDTLVSPGKSYVMMDIGGGTLDVTAHESLDGGKIREIYKVTGGAHGGMYVDGNFVSLLENRYGQSAIKDFRLRYPKDWLELMNNFEEKKTGRRASEGKVTRIRASKKFLQTVSSTSATAGRPHDEYVILEPEEMKQLFEPVVSEIVAHMEEVLKHPELNSVSCLFMVGGFAKSLILQEAIATAFSSRCKILIPTTDPAIAVVQGATMFGQKPTTISSRVMTTTYGHRIWENFDPKVHDPQKKAIIEGREKCKDIFRVVVKENEAVEVGETKRTIWNPIYSDQKSVEFTFYTSTNPDVKYTTDPTVGPSIGKMTVDSPDTSKGKNRQIELSIFFGGTEIKASAIDKTSGNVAAVKLDFLSKS